MHGTLFYMLLSPITWIKDYNNIKDPETIILLMSYTRLRTGELFALKGATLILDMVEQTISDTKVVSLRES
ncbi:hypothetical protein GCM10010954_15830 [Halobacillus andaensis]|uniref:Uncharacterized protein n=2 Tax=Halobacillus andaensis TaxID=1176239 RepID=A0A917EUW1_HALAA|nr:hypothetical protein GCM10010954_15830 [Halobacillus andaensis]